MILIGIGILILLLWFVGYPIALVVWMLRTDVARARRWLDAHKPCASCGRMIRVTGPAWCSEPCAAGKDEAATERITRSGD